MGWTEARVDDQRVEFARLALLEGANRRELCRRFGVSAPTGYKWLNRFVAGETSGQDRSRRPLTSPFRSAPSVEAAVLAQRDARPAWGARKIAARLEEGAFPGVEAPAHSTVHAILARHGRIVPPPGGPRATLRFEKEAPNQLWQMDFKGWSRLNGGGVLHPLTIVDDHSRFSLAIEACADQTGATVRQRLERVFRVYGLPLAFFVDNGKPWGDSQGGEWTRFGVWLLKLGVALIHSRPYHPQSRGKVERFHRSMDDEVFAMRPLRDHEDAQRAFDAWRQVYNFERPHGGIDHKTPASRYVVSKRAMPAKLPEPEYAEGEITRRISTTKLYVQFAGQKWKVPEAFAGETLAIRPTAKDGVFGVFFASHQIIEIDLTRKQDKAHGK